MKHFIIGFFIGSITSVIAYELYNKVLCKTEPYEEKDFKEPTVKEEKTVEEPVKHTNEDATAIERSYTTLTTIYEGTEDTSPKEVRPAIEIIGQEEFDHEERFDKAALYLYNDDVLATEEDEIVYAADVIGLEAIGELENEEVIYVRNAKLGMDYEVTRVFSSFSDVTGEILAPLRKG